MISSAAPRFRRLRGRACALACLAGLGGCASLPSSGPTQDQILAEARRTDTAPGFAVVDLTPADVARANAKPEADSAAFARLPAAGPVDVIGAGDELQISVFEVGASLFSARGSIAPEAPSTPAAAVGEILPLITVDRDGSILLPYLGRVPAAGLTPGVLAARVQAALAGKSQAPQVLISIHGNVNDTVVVMGDVKKPGRIALTLAHERVLDAIALAGGVNNLLEDETVHIRRGSADATASLNGLTAGSIGDVLLGPQDRVEVSYAPRTFTVFGATGKVSEIPFQSPHLSLAGAIARAGGPSDQQADARAVYVFRYERTGPDGPGEGRAMPVAYHLDMMQARSYFLAQRFEMQPHDVIYIANARSDQAAKMLQILNLFFQPIYTGKVLAH